MTENFTTSLKIRAKTNIPNIRIFIRNKQSIHLNSIRVLFLTILEVSETVIKLTFMKILTILRLLITGNIEKGGVNAYHSSIRFVLALFKIPFYIQLLPDYIQGAAKVLSKCFTMNYK